MARSVVIEDCLRLDIRWLNRHGSRHGWHILSYTSGASIEVFGRPDAINVSYRVSGEPVSSEIQVLRIPVQFGGEREWLQCPNCLKRFDILYIATRRFLCRRCNGLAYQTQREKRGGRQLIKAHRLWKRAGLEFGGEGERPKWMHRRKFERLTERADVAYWASWDTPFLRRLMAEDTN
jgi:hypothetical protein